jgi:hypothetical protein
MATKLNTILESPGVVINEREVSRPTTNAVGTNIFVPGFTPQGPTDEPINVSSLQEFEEIYGLPQTAAEKYSHNAVKQILTTSNAALTFTRMPYGSGGGYGYAETYNALVFPVVGLSAVEKSACTFFRETSYETIQSNYPWLLENFIPKEICYGSVNLECPLTSSDEDPGYIYIHDHPFQYNSVLTSFKFVVDADTNPENMIILQLRPQVIGFNTQYTVVKRMELSAFNGNLDESAIGLSQDLKQLTVTLSATTTANRYTSAYSAKEGILKGYAISGVPVSAGDVFATYSFVGAPVLKYYNATADVAGSYKATTVITTISSSPVSSGGAGATFTVVTSAKDATTLDALISFCAVPLEAGLTCDTITALGLEIPEEERYTFKQMLGDALLNDANFYALGEPISKTLNAGEYQLLQNSQFNWKCGVFENGIAALDVVNNNIQAGIVVVNKIKSTQMEDFTGYYMALNDNLNVNPATNYDDITAVAGYYDEVCPGVSGNWVNIPGDRLNFETSATFDGTAGSITEIVHQNVGTEFGKKEYNDSLILSLFKIKPSRLTETINKLDQVRLEQFVGSLNATRKIHDDFGGPDRSFFLEKTVNDGSNYLEVYVNPYLSTNNCWNNTVTGLPQKTVRMFRKKTSGLFDSNFDPSLALKGYGDRLYGTGSYAGTCVDAAFNHCIKKDIGNMPAKLERALRLVENPIEYPIDITIDNGLSTIWATRAAIQQDHCFPDVALCYNFDDTYFVNTDSLSPYDGTTMNSNLQDNWEVIFNIFDSFARYTRKAAGGVPHIHIQDPLRQIFVNGKDYKVINRQKSIFIDPVTNQPSEKYATFGRNIYSYLRNLYDGISSSHSISYANWFKTYDTNTDSFGWFGSSAFEAALYARNDTNAYPWLSPLGVNNGQIANIVDIAINPNQRERDLISRISLNPVVRFPEGNLNWNSTTLIKESSALKEISIRRGALWLAKSIQQNLVQYIGEPNNITTRSRINNTLKPILDFMKDNNGLYDYLIVCDERNNTAASIDQGVLNIAVYVKPTRTVKFILVDFVISGTGANFNELI